MSAVGTSRHRTRSIAWPSPNQYHTTLFGADAGTVTNSSLLSYNAVMDDVIETTSARPDHLLSLSQTDNEYMNGINGVAHNGGYTVTYTNYMPAIPIGHLTTDVPAISGSDFNKVIGRSNPSRPGLSPLELIQDLVDIPKQLMDIGKVLRRPRSLLSAGEIANQNLSIQFGWLPLIRDVQSLFSFQASVNRRLKELYGLYHSGKGLHRTIHLDRGSANSDRGLITLASNAGGSVVARVERSTFAEKWGAARWLPASPTVYNPSDDELIRKARQVAAGLTVEGIYQGLWNVLPWTWLVDWFGGVGEFASSYSNTLPAACTSCTVMLHIQTEDRYVITSRPTGVTGGDGSVFLHTKSRSVGTSSLTAYLPIISASDLSILSSLFIQRVKR
jgi:hypothetical protein